jgi:glycosyltransferase involved in cell wall biosynthesis
MEKKALYVMRYRDQNLRNKFDGQIKSLSEIGYRVYYFMIQNGCIYLVNNESEVLVKRVHFSGTDWYHHTKWFIDLVISTISVMKKESFDFVYVRSFPLGFFRWLLYKKINISKIPLVVEIPTYIEGRHESQKRLLYDLVSHYTRLWNGVSAKYVTLFTLIGDKTSGVYQGRPAINIQNATDVESFRPVKLDYEEKCINLVGISSMAHWHGYDRLIRGLANYQETNYKVIFHIVGDGVMYDSWRKLAEELNVCDKVIFHGSLYGEDLSAFLDRCDVGISSLGLYRNGILQASILKAREYMSRGLPFVYAGNDESIGKDIDYCLQISNDDSEVDVSQIVEFAIQLRKRKDLQESMRSYAMKNMSWTSQWEKVIGFLHEAVISNSRPNYI